MPLDGDAMPRPKSAQLARGMRRIASSLAAPADEPREPLPEREPEEVQP